MKNLSPMKALLYLMEKKKKYYIKNGILFKRGFLFDEWIGMVHKHQMDWDNEIEWIWRDSHAEDYNRRRYENHN